MAQQNPKQTDRAVTDNRVGEAARGLGGADSRDRVRARRRQIREAEIPDSFSCEGCEKPIEGTVVFWWNGNWGRARAHDVTWCEPCWTAERIEKNSERVNPEARFDPFHVGSFEPMPCGHCSRQIRWGHPAGFCCERCAHEAGKAARRLVPEQKFCLVCGEAFMPRRSDAVTCSDRCRQAKRRMGYVTDSRVHRARARASDTDNRDARKPKKRQGNSPGASSKGVRGAPTASKPGSRPVCGWIGGCTASATHTVALGESETGWQAKPSRREPGQYCERHANMRAAAPRCKECDRPATHLVAMGSLTGAYRMRKAAKSASYCKRHAEAQAVTAGNRDESEEN